MQRERQCGLHLQPHEATYLGNLSTLVRPVHQVEMHPRRRAASPDHRHGRRSCISTWIIPKREARHQLVDRPTPLDARLKVRLGYVPET